MFNDQYGLTQAVLEGRKTQTRRILNPTMLFERLDTSNSRAMEERKYKLQQAASGMQDTQGSTWINAWNQYGAASLSEVPGRK